MKTRYAIIILAAVQLAFILLLRADFLTDWDSYLYTEAALNFQPVELAGGRWFFTAALGVLWQAVNRVAGVDPDSAWRVFSAAMILPALVNVGLFLSLARRWTDRETAIVATSLFAGSLLVGLYGSAVMTETVTTTCLLGSLVLLSPPPAGIGRTFLAGLVFGLGCAIREPLILLVPLALGLIADPRRLHRGLKIAAFLLTLTVVLLVHVLAVRLTAENWPEIAKNWSMGMTRERLMMVDWLPKMIVVNLICLVAWLILFSPFILLTLPDQIKRARTTRPFWLAPLMAGVGLYLLGQIANHTLVFNPRFVMFPGILLLIPTALALRSKVPVRLQPPWRLGGIIIGLNFLILTLLGPVLQDHYFSKSQAARETYTTLTRAPDNALFIPGKLTPAVEMYRKIHRRDWRIIYAGWDFSDKELVREVELSRQIRRPVFIVAPEYWGERRFRSLQYRATEAVWTTYLHHPSPIAHFAQLDFPPAPLPVDFYRRILNLLFS